MEISKEPTLTIAISTMNSNLERFVSSFSFESLSAADEVLIIIQGLDDKVPNKSLKDFNVICDEGFGISRSRNLGIENANSDYIWFLDDDVFLYDDSIDKIKNHLKKNPSVDLHTIRMEYLDNTSYKKYPNKNHLNRINSLRVSSVELIVSKKFVTQNDIRFNKNLGLGSKFPSTEENVFFLDIFDKGGLISHYPEFLLNHEYMDRRTIHFGNEFILKAKGAFCRRYGGITGFLILGYYSLKCLIVRKNFLVMLNLFHGYIYAHIIFGLDDE